MRTAEFISNHSIAISNPRMPFIIAEIGVNHECSLEKAKRLIEDAREGGADAVKFQTYRAEHIASVNSPAYWDTSKETTTSQYELFKKYDKFWKKEFEELKLFCDKQQIEFLSTPFDFESAEFLNDLMDTFKISSSDITNRPFIEYICKFNKPVILSTGASDIEEIKEAVSWIEVYKNPLALLHCILNYPTENQNANLGMIKGLKKEFPNNLVGYSDHTLPNSMKVLETAVLLGAGIVEKHFTFDKTLPGNDHYHAMDKQDLVTFKKNIAQIKEIYGQEEKKALDSESPARKNARRSIVLKNDMKKGMILSDKDLTFKRPAHGISPKNMDDILGKTLKRDLPSDTLLLQEHLT